LVDFDGDGRLDLVSSSNCCDTTAFHLFRRLKDGSWAPRQRLELTPPEKITGLSQGFVTVADWNGDGIPDLLCQRPFGQGIVVAFGPLREKEPITLTQEIDLRPRPAKGDSTNVADAWVSHFAVADWDRDGKPDLLVYRGIRGGKKGIEWLRNLGGPGLTRLAEGKLLVEITDDMNVMGFCAGDWNGDGWLDLLVSRSDEPLLNDEGKHVSWRSRVWLYLRE
jgi:FG-GAP-like repeat